MLTLTKAQRKAIKRVYDRNPDGAASYREFRTRVKPGGFGSDTWVFIPWCKMYLGIELDGYTHS